MNPPWGFLHATNWLCLWVVAEPLWIGGWSICVSLYIMRRLALPFLALKKVITGFEFSLQNTLLSSFPNAP